MDSILHWLLQMQYSNCVTILGENISRGCITDCWGNFTIWEPLLNERTQMKWLDIIILKCQNGGLNRQVFFSVSNIVALLTALTAFKWEDTTWSGHQMLLEIYQFNGLEANFKEKKSSGGLFGVLKTLCGFCRRLI